MRSLPGQTLLEEDSAFSPRARFRTLIWWSLVRHSSRSRVARQRSGSIITRAVCTHGEVSLMSLVVRRRARVRLVPCLLLAMVASCGPSGHTCRKPLDSEHLARPGASVSALPPNTLPRAVAQEIYAPGNIVQEHPAMTGPYPRDVIWLVFRDDATQSDRQAAVDAIQGEVIGGAYVRPGGIYYIRIPHDGTADPLHAAIAYLKTLPAVRTATPDLSLTIAPGASQASQIRSGVVRDGFLIWDA